MTLVKKTMALVVAICLLSACNNQPASNDNTANADPVKTRQNLMKDWRGANDIMKGIENSASFDAAAFAEQANFI